MGLLMMNGNMDRYVDLLDVMDRVWHRHVNLFNVVHRYGHVNLLDVMNRDVDLLHVVMVHRMHVIRNVDDVVFAENSSHLFYSRVYT